MPLHSKVKKAQALSQEAIYKLADFQQGKRKLVKTGRDYIDKHLTGILPSDVLTCFAPSGIGKTEEFCKIFSNFLDKKINPHADNYVSLEFNLEMLYFNLFLRNTAKSLNKKKSEVILKEFTEEEQAVIKEYHKALSDDRRFIVEESVNTKEFFEIIDTFCEENKSKDGIFIGIDHCKLVLPSEKGEDPLETITTYINIIRKKYKNVYFILLSQVNRSYYSVEPKERSNSAVPTTSMIFGASHFEFLSSYIVAIVNPFKTFGIQEYMKVKADRYPHLSEFETSEDKKGYVSYNAVGNMFYHILKLRDSDCVFETLHIEKMDLPQEQLDKMKQSVEDKIETAKTISLPVFEGFTNSTSPLPTVKPFEAFGQSFEKDREPF